MSFELIYCDVLFVLVLLPLTLLLQTVDNSSEYKNFILVLSGMLFLAWGRPLWILLLLATTFIDYGAGFLAGSDSKAKKICGISLSVSVNSLVFVLFTFGKDFGLSILPTLFGIGFYSLRGISYTADCFHGKIKPEKNCFYILTYMSMFPLMSAGPLVRYGKLRPQLAVGNRINSSNVSEGYSRFIIGLAKAVLVAYPLGEVYSICINSANAYGTLFGIMIFILYFSFLFKGYTDMSIGMGKMFGFVFPENFSPLSLTSGITGAVMSYNRTVIGFIDDCVFSPVNRKAKSHAPLCIAILLFSLLLGVWFGGSICTVLFCAFFGVLVVLEELFISRFFAKTPKFIVAVYTSIMLLAGFSLFAFGFAELSPITAFSNLLGFGSGSFAPVAQAIKSNCILIAFAILFLTPLKDKAKLAVLKYCYVNDNGYATYRIFQTVSLAALLLLSVLVMSAG